MLGRLGTGLVLTVLTAACGGAQAGGGVPPSVGTVAPAAPVLRRCLLLTTNDSESNFDGVVRGADGTTQYLYPLARIASAKRQALAERPDGVLLLEGGDVLQGRFLERQDGDRPRAMADNWPMYERAGYDFGVLGNHEFDQGPKAVRRALQALTTYRILASNVDGTGTALEPDDPQHPDGLFGATALARCGGVQLGLFGLLTPSTRTISDLGDVKLRPLEVAAQAAIARLRTQGAETIVLLSHLGVEDDLKLAAAVSGIDLIVGGHSHTRLERALHVGQTWVTQTGARFERLGRLDLAIGADGHIDPASHYALVPPETYPPDPAIVAATEQLLHQLVAEKVIGKREFAWDVMHVAQSQYAARATRAVAQHAAAVSHRRVDGALLNTGGFRSHTLYPPGPVTNLEVSAIHPFRNRVVLVSLSGAQLRDVLEHACGHADNVEHGANSVLWGITMRCDVQRPAARYTYVEQKPVAIAAHGERATDIAVGGQPLQPGATYTLATLDYLARGGSSYLPLQLGERKCLDGTPFRAEDKTTCSDTALLADVIAAEVAAGHLDVP